MKKLFSSVSPTVTYCGWMREILPSNFSSLTGCEIGASGGASYACGGPGRGLYARWDIVDNLII